MKALLYCPNSRPYLLKDIEEDKIFIGLHNYGSLERHASDTDLGMNLEYERLCCKTLNGEIVAECDCTVEEIKFNRIYERDASGRLHNEWWWEYRGLNIGNYQCKLAKESCLDSDAIMDYLGNKDGYAIHINNLKIFNKSKRLNEYTVYTRVAHYTKEKRYTMQMLNKAPRNMCYVWDEHNIKYVLIPVYPELLCKVLNKDCSIIIKKRVLKELR